MSREEIADKIQQYLREKQLLQDTQIYERTETSLNNKMYPPSPK